MLKQSSDENVQPSDAAYPTAMPKLWPPFPAGIKKGQLFIAGLVFVGGLAAVLYYASDGNMSILNQRLFGQVRLSTGTYSARTLHELNRLSWENGLQVLDALDTLNTNIKGLQKLENVKNPDKAALERSQNQVKADYGRLQTLLADKDVLLHSARTLRSSELYTPEYQEYLSETMVKLSALSPSLNPAKHLVEK